MLVDDVTEPELTPEEKAKKDAKKIRLQAKMKEVKARLQSASESLDIADSQTIYYPEEMVEDGEEEKKDEADELFPDAFPDGGHEGSTQDARMSTVIMRIVFH